MITYIIGPPGAGKTTYVAENKEHDTLVVDFDALAYAIGSPISDHHDEDHPSAHRLLAGHLWITAVRWIEGHQVDAFVIHADPSDAQIQMMHNRGQVIDLG